jgi:signal transduction histidine kinase
MNRKTLIFLALMIVSTIFLVYTWFLVYSDTERSKLERLEFYDHFFENHSLQILNSYESAAEIAVAALADNPTFKAFAQSVQPPVTLFNPNDFYHFKQQFPQIHSQLLRLGFSQLIVCTGEHATSKAGFIWSEKSLVYQISRKLRVNEQADSLSLCFRFDARKFLAPTAVNYFKDCQLGLIHVPDSASVAVNSSFKKINFDVFDAFLSAEIKNSDPFFSNKKVLDQLERQLGNLSMSSKLGSGFSVVVRQGQHVKVLAVSPILGQHNQGPVYLVALVRDGFMEKLLVWKALFLTVNGLMVVFILIGLLYFYRNMERLMAQKQTIEESKLRLQELNASKDKFFSIIAHDLKNPFNGIMGLSDYLQEAYEQVSDEEILDVIKEVNLASRNAFNLLQNLLEWTRSQTGALRNVPIRIEPRQVVELALETVWNLARNKQIFVHTEIKTSKMGYADQNMVATIIRNLTTNAIKFTPRERNVYISVSDFKNELVFCVREEGIGLRSDEIDKLFRIDFNFHKKGTEQENGSGLGLKLCDEFARKCGGKIWVVSNCDEGSSFFFTIPLYDRDLVMHMEGI